MNLKRVLISVVILTAIVAGCATLGLKPYADMTANEKSLFFLKTYNAQYDNTMTQVKKPGLTELQKKMVNDKRVLLIKLKPFVEAYVSTVMSGGTPSAATEAAILDLIDQLAGLGV